MLEEYGHAEKPKGTGGEPVHPGAVRFRTDLTSEQYALLNHDVRRLIVTALWAQPGMSKSQISRRLVLLPNNVDFHLNRLVKHDLVVTRRGAGNTLHCFLKGDEGVGGERRTRWLALGPQARFIARAVAERPGIGTRELARLATRSPDAVRHHLKALQESGFVRRLRLGQRVQYHPTTLLVDWFEVRAGHFRGAPAGFRGDPHSDAGGAHLPNRAGKGHQQG